MGFPCDLEESMLQIDNLNFGYSKQKKILSNINASVKPGFTFLLGENGRDRKSVV